MAVNSEAPGTCYCSAFTCLVKFSKCRGQTAESRYLNMVDRAEMDRLAYIQACISYKNRLCVVIADISPNSQLVFLPIK